MPAHDDAAQDPASLRAQYARLRQVVDLCPDAFYAIDEHGVVLMANKAISLWLNTPLDKLVGNRLIDVVEPRELAEALLRDVDQIFDASETNFDTNETVETLDAPYVMPDGETRIFHFWDIPYIDAQTGARALLGVATDVTRRKAHERVQRDLEIARIIQKNLLPSDSLDLDGFDVAGWSEAANHAGGDHFDWLPLPGERAIITLADVSGHGVGPAIVTAICRAYARATLTSDEPLGPLVTRLNALLFDDLPTDRFITFVAAIVDARESSVRLLSAGHGPMLLYDASAREVRHISAQGVPLAIFGDTIYDRADSIAMDAGDALVLVSDGFFEWPNPGGEMYGAERLAESIGSRAPGASARQLIDALRGDVVGFAEGTPQPDDMTAVVIRRTA